MIELGDCGKELLLHFQSWSDTSRQAEVRPYMIITAPRGTMALFDQNYISPDTQCEAIKAFMEQHRTQISYQEDDGEID